MPCFLPDPVVERTVCFRIQLGSAQRTSHHKEYDPREGRSVVQEVRDHYREQAATAKKVRNAPNHAEKRSGKHDAEAREKALI